MRSLTFLLVGLVALLSVCCQSENEFTLKTIEKLDSEVHALRLEIAALNTESSRLRARLLDQHLWTQLVQLDRVGSVSGDRPFVRVCPYGTLMTGARGFAGGLVDQLVVVCSAVGPGESRFSTIELEAIGAYGGEAFERLCPPRTAVVGFRGGAGDMVDGVTLVCGPIDRPAAFQAAHPSPSVELELVDPKEQEPPKDKKDAAPPPGETSNLPRIGGGGGRQYKRQCPKNMAVVGLKGMAGNVLQSFAPLCVTPLPPAETPTPKIETPPVQPTEPPTPPPGDNTKPKAVETQPLKKRGSVAP